MPEPILHEPAAVFMTLMAVILIAPLLTERVNLPGIVGLILGGMLLGQHGLNLLVVGPTMELFGAVGLIYLMFDAGLDIDLGQFSRVRNQAIVFAAISFILPQLSGIGLGRLLGLNWAAAALLGATYASQTLIAYPVLSRLGIIRNRAVSITVGATIFTDIIALLVLGVTTSMADGDFSFLIVGRLIGFAIAFALIILLAVPRLGRLFFEYVDGDAVEFQFVLVVLFVAAVGAEWIGMHTIVGAFLAGLAVNTTLSEHSKVVGHVHFLGDSLFVPLFLLTVGMRLDPLAVVTDVRTLLIGVGLTVAVYTTKFAASWITAQIYDFSPPEMMTTWGLSQAQAAATLAAILVGTEAGLFSQSVFNGAILTVLFTTLTSPIIVRRFGKRLSPSVKAAREEKPTFQRIVVPILGEEIPRYLLDLAAILTHAREGTLLPVIIADDEKTVKERVERFKKKGLTYPETETALLQRIEPRPYEAILRIAGEENASMIMMAWSGETPVGDRMMENHMEQVIWNAQVPVLVSRMTMASEAQERVVLVIAAKTVGVKLSDEAVDAVRALAQAVDLPLLVLATSHYVDELKAELEGDEAEIEVEIIHVGDDTVEDILSRLDEHDQVVLTTMSSRDRFATGEDRVPELLAEHFSGSLSILHYP